MAEAVMEKDMNVLKEARKASLMTQGDVAKLFGCSIPKVTNQERRPDLLSIADLSAWHGIVCADGKEWIREFVNSFFID